MGEAPQERGLAAIARFGIEALLDGIRQLTEQSPRA